MVLETKFFFEKEALGANLRDAAIRDDLKIQISQFIKFGFESRFVDIDDKVKIIVSSSEATREEYFKLCLEEARLNERLEAVKKNLSERDFGDEFEKISDMEGVGTVRVINKENNSRLLINLKRIFQLGPSLIFPEQRYDLGEFEIEIDPFVNDYGAIHFYQNRKRGPYKHAYAAIDKTCFGNSSGGLNKAITDLMCRFNVVPLVHLLLSFLIKETTSPTKIIDSTTDSADCKNDNYQPSPDNFYTSNEDRELAKVEFIKLLQEVAFLNSSAKSRNELEELQKKIGTLLKQRQAYYVAIKETEDILNFYERKITGSDKLGSEVVEDLLGDSSVFWLGAEEDSLAIFFELPVPPANFSKETLGIFEEILGYILIIRHDQPIELLFLKNQRIGDGNEAAAVPMKLLDGNDYKEDFEKNIAELQAGCKIYKLLALSKDLILDFWRAQNQGGEDGWGSFTY